MTPSQAKTAEANGSPNGSQVPEAGVQHSWTELVEKIKNDDPAGMEELYRVFCRGIRFYLCRQLGPQDMEDKIHDTFLIVAQAIRRGDLREPERLMGYVRTIAKRQVAGQIEQNTQDRKQQADLDLGLTVLDTQKNPEQAAIERQQQEIARKVLQDISERDREILMRFYLQQQSQEEICREMDLTETQFRLLKSRAKARFGELGKRKLGRRLRFFD